MAESGPTPAVPAVLDGPIAFGKLPRRNLLTSATEPQLAIGECTS